MDFLEKLQILKESGLTHGGIAELLGYSKGQKIFDIMRGLEGMGGPARMCLAYYLVISELPESEELIERALGIFKDT